MAFAASLRRLSHSSKLHFLSSISRIFHRHRASVSRWRDQVANATDVAEFNVWNVLACTLKFKKKHCSVPLTQHKPFHGVNKFAIIAISWSQYSVRVINEWPYSVISSARSYETVHEKTINFILPSRSRNTKLKTNNQMCNVDRLIDQLLLVGSTRNMNAIKWVINLSTLQIQKLQTAWLIKNVCNL